MDDENEESDTVKSARVDVEKIGSSEVGFISKERRPVLKLLCPFFLDVIMLELQENTEYI